MICVLEFYPTQPGPTDTYSDTLSKLLWPSRLALLACAEGDTSLSRCCDGLKSDIISWSSNPKI